MRYRLGALFFAATVTIGGSASRASAEPFNAPVEVDRVLAIVDDQMITWLDVRARIAPFEKQILPKDAGYAKRHDALVADMLQKRIDELLVAAATDRAHIVVDSAEIKSAVSLIAKEQHFTDEQLETAVKQQGMSMAEYRAEIRRQLLEAKYVRLDMANEIIKQGIKDEDKIAWIEKRREVALKKLRAAAFIEVKL